MPMRRIIAILLLFLISSPLVLKTGILGWYFWNKADITAKFCINKVRPSLKCDGKCYLVAKLKKAAEPDDKMPVHPAKSDKKLGFCLIFLVDEFVLFVRHRAGHDNLYIGFADSRIPAQLFFGQIFKPPA